MNNRPSNLLEECGDKARMSGSLVRLADLVGSRLVETRRQQRKLHQREPICTSVPENGSQRRSRRREDARLA